MTLRQMVDQHSAALKAQQARMTLVDETVVVGRRHLRHEPLIALRRSLRLFRRLLGQQLCFSVRRVHPLHVLFQFVLSLELLAATLTQELAMVTVPQHV